MRRPFGFETYSGAPVAGFLTNGAVRTWISADRCANARRVSGSIGGADSGDGIGAKGGPEPEGQSGSRKPGTTWYVAGELPRKLAIG